MTQAKAASDAAVNMIKSVYSEQQENKDYIKVSSMSPWEHSWYRGKVIVTVGKK